MKTWKIQASVALGAIGFTVGLLALQSCELFAPSKEELMAYCVADPATQKRAAEVGVSVEELCAAAIAGEEKLKDLTCDKDAGVCRW